MKAVASGRAALIHTVQSDTPTASVADPSVHRVRVAPALSARSDCCRLRRTPETMSFRQGPETDAGAGGGGGCEQRLHLRFLCCCPRRELRACAAEHPVLSGAP